MELSDSFSGRLKQRLNEAEAAKAGRSQENEKSMGERDGAYGRFERVAEPIHRSIIIPAMDELARGFANARVEHFKTSVGFFSQSHFTHTPRFQATGKLLVGLEWDEAGQHAWVDYVLDILPALIPYETSDRFEVSLGAPNLAEVRDWVESRLMRFLDTYLQVESDPHYQAAGLRIDPVCGMQVSPGTATHTSEHGGKTFYFCSQVCLERFAAEPDLYATGKAVLGG